MRIEDLKKMATADLMKAKVIIVTECSDCPSFHGTFDIPNCSKNNKMILGVDEGGFSTECELIPLGQLVDLVGKKQRICTCDRCRDAEKTKH